MNLNLLATIYGAFLGPILASFSAVVIERGRKGLSLKGRSKCICGRQLSWYLNIPIFSYLIILGKSTCCKSRIPIWYLIYEVIAFLLGITLTTFLHWWGILILIAIITFTSLILKK